MRTKITTAVAAIAFVMAGCGSSKSATPATTQASEAPSAQPSAAAAPATTAAPAGASAVASTTAAAAPSSSAAAASSSSAPVAPASSTAAAPAGPACTGLGAAGSGAAADVKLVEWSISGPAAVKAGEVTLNITNGGQNKHNLAVVKGTWADLPKSGSGGLDDAKLAGGSLLGTADELNGGKSCSTTLKLDAGSYTLLCTLGFGGNSHAARGQHFDLTVAP